MRDANELPLRRYDVFSTRTTRVIDAVITAIGVLTLVGCATAVALCVYGLRHDRAEKTDKNEETPQVETPNIYDSRATDPSNAVVLSDAATSNH